MRSESKDLLGRFGFIAGPEIIILPASYILRKLFCQHDGWMAKKPVLAVNTQCCFAQQPTSARLPRSRRQGCRQDYCWLQC